MFPILEVSKLAEKESWRKEVNRPIYHIHKWWAQRLGSVFRSLLLYLIDPENTWDSFYKIHNYSNLTVLDPFMGSGTTIGEALKLGMKAIGCDINPISSFLVEQELTPISIGELCSEFDRIERDVSHKILSYYKTINPATNKEIPVLYYFWVKIATTPDGEEIPLFSKYIFSQNAYPSKKPDVQILCPDCWNVFEGKYSDTEVTCPHCGYNFNPQIGPANNTYVISRSGCKYKIKDLLPKKQPFPEKMYALLAVDENDEKLYLPIRDYDLALYKQATLDYKDFDSYTPSFEVKSGYNTDQAIGYNYTSWASFFNTRQLLCLNILLSSILATKRTDIKNQLLCLFSSTLEFNNMFCSFKGEGTGAVRPIFSNHILKPERTPLENSIWGYEKSSGCFSSLFRTRLLKAKKYLEEPFELCIEKDGTCSKPIASNQLKPILVSSWTELESQSHSALILNGDSSTLPIPDEAVDFVVTDPPYFDFVHYSELSDFFFAWLCPLLTADYPYFISDTSRRDNEVQQVDAKLFSKLLGNVFKESYRVLKSTGKLAFSFHHSRPDGWIAIAAAIQSAGLYIEEVFPVHAELMASTPKAGAKEPISVDAMIICSKEYKEIKPIEISNMASSFVSRLSKSGKKLSKSDVFVITASQCLSYIVNEKVNEAAQYELIEQVYEAVLLNSKGSENETD